MRTISLTGASGTHDVYLVGGSGTINLDWIKFTNSATARLAGRGNESTGPDATVLDVYPNPAHSVLHIRPQAGHRGAQRVVLTDLLGRQVLAEAATLAGEQRELKLDVSRVGKGVYLLTVETQGGKQAGKITIVK